jgi:hypothetical protein
MIAASAAEATLSLLIRVEKEMDMTTSDPKREFFRHTLATLAYRGGKAIRNEPEGFSNFRAAEGSRSAGEILAHIGDLLAWAYSLAAEQEAWSNAKPQAWEGDSERFFALLKKLDDHLASSNPVHVSLERLFQGPIADAFTHVGQIGMLRRLAGSPVKGENYSVAEVVAGSVGPEQQSPHREF